MSVPIYSQGLRGFTLLEIMLTMALFAIVAFLASPFYGNFMYKQELSVVSAELRGSLAKAQLNSMQSKNASAWSIWVDNGNIILFRGDSFGSRDQSFDQLIAIHPKI